MENKNEFIGFIGTGVMGKSMIANLLQGGKNVLIYNRTKEKADSLIKQGAIWKNSVKEIAKEASIIFTMVGYPKDIEDIYFGEDGIIENSRKGTILVDMTTSNPSLASKIYDKSLLKGIYSLDAPVSGGDIGAKNGTLTIMVGGDESIFDSVYPIFSLLGKNIILQGKAGAGQHTKMCNQIAIASNMMGVCESMIYAKNAGLDPEKVLESIGSGAAGSWSLNNLAPRMLNGDFEPGFYIKHFIKDMTIALEEAKIMGIKTPGLELSKSLYDELIKMGKENKGTQALYQLLNK